MAHKFDPEHREMLHSTDRLEWQNPLAILETFGLKRGMRVADVGCGTGFFAIPAAKLVGPEGRVYGVDMQEEMLWTLQERLLEARVWNVLPLLSREDRITLPDGHADAAILINTLHEVVGEGTLREIHRLLKQSGFLGVVDWKKEPMDKGPPLDHRLSVREAKKKLEGCGFKAVEVEVGTLHYGLRATKR